MKTNRINTYTNKQPDDFSKFGKGQIPISKRLTNNAVICTRVSSKEQAENNGSLETQKKYCLSYAEKNSLNILGYFGGTYESAKTDERNEFNRMLKFVKNHKEKITYILVYTLDRFSRTGDNAIYISSEIKKLGIYIVSVTQPIDTSTDAGTLQQNIQFIFSKYDNDQRKLKCVNGMRDKLRKGYWLGAAPIGYQFTNDRKEQNLIINEKGALIKKAFKWKAEGMPNMKIMERLKAMGLKLKHKQHLTKILKNPFYCGMIAHSMLEGEVVEGRHPALISKELFFKANSINTHKGYKVSKENEQLPLKQFIRCAECGTPFTGYIAKKRIYYYKCNKIGCKCNRNAEVLHSAFTDLLRSYSIDNNLIPKLQKQLEITYDNLTESVADDNKALLMKRAELKEKLEKVEERFAYGEIDRSIYEKVALKLKEELEQIDTQIQNSRINLSNAEKYLNYSVNLSSKLATVWTSADYEQKQNLQKLIFPDGIVYDKKNDNYRTPKINFVFHVIAGLSRDSEQNKKGTNEIVSQLVPLGADGGTRTPTPRGTRS
jgi:site-specific DNA recombinase